MEIEAGTIVANRYRVTRPIGRGGMGEVFAAENTRTGRPVAIKVLHADAKAKASAVERFRREARAAGSINSDYVTQVLDVEEDATFGIVLVFELLEGESLIERLKRTGPIPFDELYVIIDQVWMGLADAHRVKIIHRDLKPSNIFLERRPDGTTRVKILDFGISKLPKEMEGETLTEMGQSLGTFSFMPPEQIGKAKMVDERADIYACTTMIYQSLTGQLPYLAKNVLVMVEMKAKAPPRRISDAMDGAVDPRLEAFVARGLARDPDQRFQNAVEALSAWRDLGPRATGQYALVSSMGTAHTQPAPSTSIPSARASSQGSPPTSMPGGPRGTIPYDVTRHEPHIRRPDPIDIASENTTDDAAATLAMPIARLMPNQGAGGPVWPPLGQGAAPSGSSAARPSPSGYGPNSNNYTGASSSGTYGVVQPPGYGGPMQNPSSTSMQGGYPDAQGYAQRPMSMPQQQAAWPQQTGVQPQVVNDLVPQPPAPRRVWPFLLGGVLFALIGFGIVAAIMLSTGK